MHLCILLSPVDALLGWSAYFFLHLLARPFLGLVDEADYPSIKFTPDFWCIWHLPIIGILLLQGVSSNTSESKKNIEDSARYLRVPLQLLGVRYFPEEAPKMSAKLLNVYARFVFTVIFNILLSVSALVDGLMLILRPQCPFGGLVSFILCTKGIQSYWWVCFTITKRCPGKSSPCLLFLSYFDKKGFWGIYFLLSDGISLVSFFTIIL